MLAAPAIGADHARMATHADSGSACVLFRSLSGSVQFAVELDSGSRPVELGFYFVKYFLEIVGETRGEGNSIHRFAKYKFGRWIDG
jgi:hypothetical protein